ncbi:MAG: PLP-dependent aspartate aminotransferase family protein [Kiloniellales bacterium]|nr:PLP-dependent aspartate aminotransferase family protein [Kiloniellales bacterium]
MTDERALSPRSILAQIDHYLDPATGAVSPPIQPATTFARGTDHEPLGAYRYARTRSPSDDLAERVFAELDGGAEARLFGSGMAAVTSLFETVDGGRHVVAPRVMYHAAQDWLRRISQRRGIGLTLFDASDPAALAGAIRPGETDIVWIESATNPNWQVIDIAAAAEAAHAAGALLGVDSTVAPPVTTRPIELGADFVFHSATKYLNGHSDVTAGVLVAAKADERWEEVKLVRNLTGGMLGAFEAWLLLRGLRTLAIRFDQASRNALALARHFEGHAKLEAVLYPGLESHPGHDVARRQMTGGFGGMLSIMVRGGTAEAKAVATGTRLFVTATSLGGVESLIEHRATIEGPHSAVADNLLRLSVGIEDTDDLIADLEQALARI